MANLKNLIVQGASRFIGDVTGEKFIIDGGTSSQFLKADGSVDNTTYLTSSSITGKEDTSNKVTSISSSSTNTQYPSALAVYTAISNASIGGSDAGECPDLSLGTTTGNGNAVTDISVSGHQITLTKGSTFLTSHQDISGKADKAIPSAANNVALLNASGNLVDSGKTLGKSVPSNAVFTDVACNEQYHYTPSTADNSSNIDLVPSGVQKIITAINLDSKKHVVSVTSGDLTKNMVGLDYVTNDKQVKGLASGTTSGHIVTFGAEVTLQLIVENQLLILLLLLMFMEILQMLEHYKRLI